MTEVSRPPEPGSPDSPLVDLDGTLYPAGAQLRPQPGTPTDLAPELTDSALSYDTGLELKARSQWAYARSRFFRHRLAMGSLVVLVAILLCGAFAGHIASYPYDGIDLNNLNEVTCSGCSETFSPRQARDLVAAELARWDAVCRWIELAPAVLAD